MTERSGKDLGPSPDNTLPPSRAERLDALLEKVAPKALEESWPVKPERAAQVATHKAQAVAGRSDKSPEEAVKEQAAYEAPHRAAPYIIENVGTRVRIKITKDDGDVVTGLGDDIDGALSALEAKLS